MVGGGDALRSDGRAWSRVIWLSRFFFLEAESRTKSWKPWLESTIDKRKESDSLFGA